LEADVGVSLHPDTLEARLAFRTRVLDYIWAGLPMIVTAGDAASELVAQYDLGSVVAVADVDGVASAILKLVGPTAAGWKGRFEEVRLGLTWENAAQALLDFCKAPHLAADRRAGRKAAVTAESIIDSLDEQMQQQEAELARLRDLVDRYERGRFISLMRRIDSTRHRLLGNQLMRRWLDK
jgi:hypothetical protein